MGKRKKSKRKFVKRREENLKKLIEEINTKNDVKPEKVEEYNQFHSPLPGNYNDYCKSISDIDRFLFTGTINDDDEDVIILPPPVTIPPEIKAREVNRV